MSRLIASLSSPSGLRLSRRLLALIAALLVVLAPSHAWATGHVQGAHEGTALVAPPVPASYVTQNHDFGTIAFEPGARERVGEALEAVRGFRDELRGRFGHEVLGQVDVRVVSTPADMRALAPQDLPPPAYATGVAYPSVKLVLVSLIEPRSFEGTDLAEVLKHELAHIALDEAVEGARVPRWFNEGVAIYVSGENAGARMQALASASMGGALVPIAALDRSFGEDGDVNTAYAESADFVRFLLRSEDRDRFRSMVTRVRGGAAFDRALEDAYDAKLSKLEYQWREQVSRRYAYYPAIFGSSMIWVGVIGVLGWAYWKKHRRSRTILAAWGREERLEDELLLARAELAGREGRDPPSPLREDRSIRRAPVAVEHEGRVYNVH